MTLLRHSSPAKTRGPGGSPRSLVSTSQDEALRNKALESMRPSDIAKVRGRLP